MHLPRPRLRLRTLLIAVAVAGLALGGWQMWERRVYCLACARALEQTAAQRRLIADLNDRVAKVYREANDRVAPRPVALDPSAAAWEAAYFVWLDRLWEGADRRSERSERERAKARSEIDSLERSARRYRHVARHPWLPLPREPE